MYFREPARNNLCDHTAPFVLPPPIIGCKPLTCITFDEPLLDWKCDFIASKGLFLKNFGVEIRKNCGLCGDCGQFVRPSKIELPFFKNHDFFDFSVSVWFKRRGANGCMPVVVSNGDCDQAAVQVRHTVLSLPVLNTFRSSGATMYAVMLTL